ncbi:MAG: histidine--tRNA ligase [Candidatus Vogelbacteria bacterium CG10_big_fil_rev_8_21_14_0_10_51_16]|uniref:Histidine--tRNA ligase n=1 Tax=Candidatus Vogelbacteria bacterium CG10_big_fil_rev_8_21_14_0_10_51_16 TaxID=1975045 RepID=A0A2H0RGA2_9BACT|nr:MAG: histidine--tRNA ligase [Candidatus Vogelbacteria bacterium CG10_big_fil_rev_8_21_14_0_10_51_16]
MVSTKKTKTKIGGTKTNAPFQVPKGMRDRIGHEVHELTGFIEKATEICLYYGFKPIVTPLLEDAQVYSSSVGISSDIVEKEMYTVKTKGGDVLAVRPEFTASVMRSYLEQGMQNQTQPVMLYYSGPCYRYDRPQRGRWREFYQFGLEILGTEKSIADAMVIELTMLSLRESGLQNLRLLVNSIGDKDCRPGYRRELIAYYRKHQAQLCKDCKARLKSNPLRILDCKEPQCAPLKFEAPQSVSSLCDPCKKHFKEVLEYLESLGIEYVIDSTLVRGLDYYTRTVFEIQQETRPPEVALGEVANPGIQADTPLTIAGGGRYDYLARTLGSKRDVPGVGSSIGIDRVLMAEDRVELMPRVIKKPKVYFIQLGFEAKLKSMNVIEVLRKGRVSVVHSLSKDSLGSQLGTAEKLQIPYAIILGQREVIDNTVIVRNMDNRSQDVVKVSKLADYLKKLRI